MDVALTVLEAMDQIAELRWQLRKAQQALSWISVEDRLPEDVRDANGGANSVLAYWRPGVRADNLVNPDVSVVAYLHRGGKGLYSHWMPLPPSPSFRSIEEEVNKEVREIVRGGGL